MTIRIVVKSCRAVLIATALLCVDAVCAETIDFKSRVLPILRTHCFKCHGEETQKSDFRLDVLSPDLIQDRPAAERWHDVRDALNLGEMPPQDEPELAAKDRQVFVRWINQQLDALLAAEKTTGGRVVLRRLNRTEYQNTMRDLLGIETNFASNLPPESFSTDGFRNNGSALQMSDLQLEYYLEAAREGLRKVIVTKGEPQVLRHTFSESVQDKNRGSNVLDDDEQFVAKLMEYPSEGEFLIRVKARAKLVDTRGYPQLRVAVGYRADVQAPRVHMDPVDVSSEQWQTYEFRDRIEHFPLPSKSQSKFPGLLVWLDNAYAEGLNKPLKARRANKKKRNKNKKNVDDSPAEEAARPPYPTIEIASMEFVGPVFDQWPPAHHTQILFPSKKRDRDEEAYAGIVVKRFMKRAFRREVSNGETRAYRDLFHTLRESAESFEEAIQETLAMVLISPEFLYLAEPGGESKRPLTDWELASRLSYFLWSSMPDQRLSRLARAGKLHEPDVLRAEVGRMIQDERSWQFVEQFAGQWLDVGALDRVAVNPEYYPEFDNQLKVSMRDETLHFFAEILYKNLSVLNFLDSDFAMLNEPLARHYGLAPPRGSGFERVALSPGDHRGGVLAHASVLLGNSTGADSHPVKRAVWIRDRLLDDPPADPPANVPSLDSTDPKFASLPVREQLRVHRQDAACNDCHRGIDPWGIAIENFGADGLWRHEILRKNANGRGLVGQRVMSATTLPDGSKLEGFADLKAYLLEHRAQQFSKAFTKKLLTYALGRSLELTDEGTLEQLTEEFVAADYRIENLIQLVVASEPFQTK